MPTGDAVIGSEQAFEILEGIGNLGLWLQTIGILAIVWIIFNIVDWIINSRRLKLLNKIIKDMRRIENKIDTLYKAKKKQLS